MGMTGASELVSQDVQPDGDGRIDANKEAGLFDCPVCPMRNLEPNGERCPNCGTDLTPLLRVKELPQALAVEAAGLAARGANDEALRSASTALRLGGPQPGVLLLLGKLLEKQDRLVEALGYINSCLKAQPENTEAATEKVAIEKRFITQRRQNLLWKAGVPTVLLMGLIAAWGLHVRYAASHQSTNEEVARLASALQGKEADYRNALARAEQSEQIARRAQDEIQHSQDKARRNLDEAQKLQQTATSKHQESVRLLEEAQRVRTELIKPAPETGVGESLTASRQPLPSLLAEHMEKIAGISVRNAGNTLEVRFTEGLFLLGSDEPQENARVLLDAVAKVLGEIGEPLMVMIEGRTDDLPVRPGGRWEDDRQLTLARAAAAAHLLSRQLDSGVVTVVAKTSSRHESPYPNDSTENRQRNRTVLLHIETAPHGR